MKVYKCDRCNKDIELRNRIDTKEWDNTRDRFDLCNKCFKAFEEFVYGEADDDTERMA